MESYATEQMEVRLAPPCAALLRLALHPNPDPDPNPNPITLTLTLTRPP